MTAAGLAARQAHGGSSAPLSQAVDRQPRPRLTPILNYESLERVRR